MGSSSRSSCSSNNSSSSAYKKQTLKLLGRLLTRACLLLNLASRAQLSAERFVSNILDPQHSDTLTRRDPDRHGHGDERHYRSSTE